MEKIYLKADKETSEHLTDIWRNSIVDSADYEKAFSEIICGATDTMRIVKRGKQSWQSEASWSDGHVYITIPHLNDFTDGFELPYLEGFDVISELEFINEVEI